MLGYVVAKLNHLGDIINEVQQLGARHHQYGSKPEHYDVVGQCLLATLKDGLGDKWNDEVEKAWQAAFSIIKQRCCRHKKQRCVILQQIQNSHA